MSLCLVAKTCQIFRNLTGLPLRVAGYQGQLSSGSFLSGVHDHTKGVARKINNICRNALLLGATEQKQVLDQEDLKRVLLDLEGQIT